VLPLALTDEACVQNLFFSVCSVTSVAKSYLFTLCSLLISARLNPNEYTYLVDNLGGLQGL
jgi:hypothetical protein